MTESENKGTDFVGISGPDTEDSGKELFVVLEGLEKLEVILARILASVEYYIGTIGSSSQV